MHKYSGIRLFGRCALLVVGMLPLAACPNKTNTVVIKNCDKVIIYDSKGVVVGNGTVDDVRAHASELGLTDDSVKKLGAAAKECKPH